MPARALVDERVEITLTSERLDDLMLPMMRAAMTGDPAAIKLALILMDRRAHLMANMP